MAKTKVEKKNIHLLRQIRNIFMSKSVIISIFVTLSIMVFFNFVSKIPMPFLKVNPEAGGMSDKGGLFSMLNLIGGGGLTNLSLFTLGITPYVTVQIFVQLLSFDPSFPLSKWARSGEKGRKKIEVLCRLLTLPFAVLQAFTLVVFIGYRMQSGAVTFSGVEGATTLDGFYTFFYIVLMTAGTYIAIFLGDIITKRGVGNGTTIIILTGIVSSLIPNFIKVFTNINGTVNGELYRTMAFIVYIIFYCMILWATAFVNLSTRKLPIQQTGQAILKLGDDLPYLPFKINPTGILPVIVASAGLSIPISIGNLVEIGNPGNGFTQFTEKAFSFGSWPGVIIYCILIILSGFIFSGIQINSEDISKQFMQSGKFIIGVKIGKTTEEYIRRVLYRVNWIGSPMLALIAAMPYIASLVVLNESGHPIIPSDSSLGGTGIVIMVTGSLDMWQSIVSASTASSYTVKRRKIEIITSNGEAQELDQGSGLW